MPPRTPKAVRPGRLGGEGTTATPTSQHWKANGSSPPRRDPPPGPHLREDQVGDARECPRNFAAIPRRDLTCARSRLGTAKKGTVISKQCPGHLAVKRSIGARRAHTQQRSNAAGPLADPMRKARVASCELSSCGGAFRTCTRTFGDPEPPMPPRTPGALKARAAWRRRHHGNRQPTDARLPMARHLPGAIPRQALTNARPKLGTPGSVLATTPQPPAGTSLTRGPGWGRRGRGL